MIRFLQVIAGCIIFLRALHPPIDQQIFRRLSRIVRLLSTLTMTDPQPDKNRESVWDYPRPPRIEPCYLHLRVEFNGETIADTNRAYRLLETSHPPTYYIPPADVKMDLLSPNPRRSFCEFKGDARYWDIHLRSRASIAAAWSYPSPSKPYTDLKDHLAFYAQRVDACFVGDERVQAQEGDFYGGWITSHIVGPFKGAPGTRGW